MGLKDTKDKLINKYRVFELEDGLLKNIADDTLKNIKNVDDVDRAFQENFKKSLKKYLIENEETVSKLSYILSNCNQKNFLDVCCLFDSLEFNNIKYLTKLYDENSVYFNSMLYSIATLTNIDGIESGTLANFMMLYQSKNIDDEEYIDDNIDFLPDNTSYDPIRIYLKEISIYPLLTADDEIELFSKYQSTSDEKISNRSCCHPPSGRPVQQHSIRTGRISG